MNIYAAAAVYRRRDECKINLHILKATSQEEALGIMLTSDAKDYPNTDGWVCISEPCIRQVPPAWIREEQETA